MMPLELSKLDMVSPSHEFLKFLHGLCDVAGSDLLLLLTKGL